MKRENILPIGNLNGNSAVKPADFYPRRTRRGPKRVRADPGRTPPESTKLFFGGLYWTVADSVDSAAESAADSWVRSGSGSGPRRVGGQSAAKLRRHGPPRTLARRGVKSFSGLLVRGGIPRRNTTVEFRRGVSPAESGPPIKVRGGLLLKFRRGI